MDKVTSSPRTAQTRVDLGQETTALADLLRALGPEFSAAISRIAEVIRETFARDNKVLVCGNGGSAAEAQHFSDEMLGRYRANRQSYPVIALTADSAALTCIGNDFGFEEVFARQVEALGQRGDVLFCLSTSGNSPNVLRAIAAAKERGMTTIGFTGPRGTLRQQADLVLAVPSASTARIQEVHLHAIHLVCEYFEPTT